MPEAEERQGAKYLELIAGAGGKGEVLGLYLDAIRVIVHRGQLQFAVAEKLLELGDVDGAHQFAVLGESSRLVSIFGQVVAGFNEGAKAINNGSFTIKKAGEDMQQAASRISNASRR